MVCHPRRAILATIGAAAILACDATAPVTTISVAPSSATLQDGTVIQFRSTVRNATTAGSVVWISSNTNVARVDANGVVSAVSNGTATLTATMTADASKSASANIIVSGPPVATIALTPTSGTVYVGNAGRITARVYASDGRQLSRRTVTWSNPDRAVADVSSQGVVTALAPGGPLAIVASSEGKTATALIRVAHGATACPFLSPITLGGSASATLSLGDCEWELDGSYVDIYEFSIATATTVQIDMSSSEVDSYLGLFTGANGFLAEDDDSGGGTDARLVLSLNPGKYRIWANCTSGEQHGNYVLTVTARAGARESLQRAGPGRLAGSPGAR